MFSDYSGRTSIANNTLVTFYKLPLTSFLYILFGHDHKKAVTANLKCPAVDGVKCPKIDERAGQVTPS